jgi:hypothetical protein
LWNATDLLSFYKKFPKFHLVCVMHLNTLLSSTRKIIVAYACHYQRFTQRRNVNNADTFANAIPQSLGDTAAGVPPSNRWLSRVQPCIAIVIAQLSSLWNSH